MCTKSRIRNVLISYAQNVTISVSHYTHIINICFKSIICTVYINGKGKKKNRLWLKY